MQRKKNFTIEMLIKSLISAGIIAIIVICIYAIQNKISQKSQYDESLTILRQISDTLYTNENTADTLTEIYHNSNLQILNDLKDLTQTDTVQQAFNELDEFDDSVLQDIMGEKFDLYLFITDVQGNVISSVDKEYVDQNIEKVGFFTEEQFNEIVSSDGNGVTCTPNGSENDYSFYATTTLINNQMYYLIIGSDNDAFRNQINLLSSLDAIVENASLGDDKTILAVNPVDKTITYCSRDELGVEGKTLEEIGLTEKILEDGASNLMDYEGSECLCVTVRHSSDCFLVEVSSTADQYSDNFRPTVWAVILLAMTLVVMISYSVFLPESLTKTRKNQKLVRVFKSKFVINMGVVSRIWPLFTLGIVLIFSVVFYCRTIVKLSLAFDEVERPLSQLKTELEDNEINKEIAQEYCDQIYLSKAQIIAKMIELDPSCLNETTDKVYIEYLDSGNKETINDSYGNPIYSVSESLSLQDLCNANDIQSIQVFNDIGFTIASSNDSWYFKLSHDSEEQSSEFFDVVDGKKDHVVQNEQIDDDGNMNQYIGVAFNYYTTLDDDGNTIYVSVLDYQNYLNGNWDKNPITMHHSLLQCAADLSVVNNMMQSLDINYIMSHVNLTNDGYMVVFDDSEDHVIIYSPNTQNIGKTAAELEVTDDEFSGSFNGFQTVAGVKYFECCRYDAGYFVAIATPLSSLYSTRLPATTIVSVACLIAMILIMGMFLVTSEENMIWLQKNPEIKAMEKEAEKEAQKEAENEDAGHKGADINIFRRRIRFSGFRKKFNEKNAEEKITVMIQFMLMIISIYFLLAFLFKGKFFAGSTIINYVFSDEWERGVNIFAFTKSVVVLFAVIAIIELLTKFTEFVTEVLNSNARTIVKMLMSFIRYASVIGAICYCMYLFGMQPLSLLASASVISIIIGLGAQSLISDMLAGLFIIFEGTLHVGDWISVNGEVGCVKEIGIRSTKLESTEKTILVYNNSNIKGINNLSVKLLRVRFYLSICYNESLERVEEILKKELPLMKDKIPGISGEPKYRGVKKLNSSSVDLYIIAYCKSEYYTTVCRGLNREILLMCKKYGIDIPFQTITTYVKESNPELIVEDEIGNQPDSNR